VITASILICLTKKIFHRLDRVYSAESLRNVQHEFTGRMALMESNDSIKPLNVDIHHIPHTDYANNNITVLIYISLISMLSCLRLCASALKK